ncbi:transglycosylase SLT domain-containing protein, partial [Rhizobium sp.]|uniref:transglycosylase SLT domain-containing protein n=1 Tax=Rhizobium sp. TaxID=391 RepID=UPI0028B17FA5
MTAKIFIDGEHGTTGLQIRTRLADRRDIELLSIPEAERRNAAMREDMLNNADISILCLPDDASREAVSMVAGNNNVRIIDTSTAYRVDPAWAYGLMRQESRFNTVARSHVGAGGLMQIMPDTAKLVARQMGEAYNPAALTDMNTNIRYGTFYLSTIQRQLSNSPVLATAGYNAGPNRARRWQPDLQNLAADQYTET